MKLARQLMTTKTASGQIFHKSAYWGTFNVGTPATAFKVVFDTGSGQLIIPTTYCKTTSCRAHTRYKRSASSTGKDIDYDGTVVAGNAARDQLTVTFGTGEVTGVLFEEQVCIPPSAVNRRNGSTWPGSAPRGPGAGGGGGPRGGAAAAPPPSPAAAAAAAAAWDCLEMRFVGAIDMPDDPFKSFQFDGILGLALEGLSEAPEFNFVNILGASLRAQGYRRPHTFAVFLADDAAEQSEVTFGGWAEEQHLGEIAWAPVLRPELGHWMIQVVALRVGGEALDYCADGQCRAVLDTGTSLLAVPRSAFKALFRHLVHPAAEGGTCDGPGPAFQIELESITLELLPHDYAMVANSSQGRKKAANETTAPKEEAGNATGGGNTSTATNHTERCLPMLMAMEFPEPLGPKLFILGEPVLRKYYTVYDADAKEVGFSRARHDRAHLADPGVAEVPSAHG